MKLATLVGAVAVALAVSAAQAATITPGFTFAVASAGGSHTVGTHFHSNTGGAYGNPAGLAEVGAYSSEEVRGLSEYNVTGLSNAPSAFVTFFVYKAGGLFGGVNDFPVNEIVNVYAYTGNNVEDISDYQAASIGFVGSFDTTGLAVGNTISFDITGIFNTLVGASGTSLGIRLQSASDPASGTGAYTFNNFRLTSDNQSTIPSVPLPAAAWGGLSILAGLGACRVIRRKA